jgi:hypothetical protein
MEDELSTGKPTMDEAIGSVVAPSRCDPSICRDRSYWRCYGPMWF